MLKMTSLIFINYAQIIFRSATQICWVDGPNSLGSAPKPHRIQITFKKCIYFTKIKRKKYSPFCDKFLLEINGNIEKNNNLRRKNHA